MAKWKLRCSSKPILDHYKRFDDTIVQVCTADTNSNLSQTDMNRLHWIYSALVGLLASAVPELSRYAAFELGDSAGHPFVDANDDVTVLATILVVLPFAVFAVFTHIRNRSNHVTVPLLVGLAATISVWLWPVWVAWSSNAEPTAGGDANLGSGLVLMFAPLLIIVKMITTQMGLSRLANRRAISASAAKR